MVQPSQKIVTSEEKPPQLCTWQKYRFTLHTVNITLEDDVQMQVYFTHNQLHSHVQWKYRFTPHIINTRQKNDPQIQVYPAHNIIHEHDAWKSRLSAHGQYYLWECYRNTGLLCTYSILLMKMSYGNMRWLCPWLVLLMRMTKIEIYSTHTHDCDTEIQVLYTTTFFLRMVRKIQIYSVFIQYYSWRWYRNTGPLCT